MKSLFLLPAFIFFFSGCQSQPSTQFYRLTRQERFYCDSMKIDSSIVVLLRSQTDSMLKPLPIDLTFVLDADFDEDSSIKHYPGFIFNSENSRTKNIVSDLYYPFRDKGYTILTLDETFGFQNKPDIIGIFKCTDKYEILRQVHTDGINWEIDNDSLIKLIKRFDKKYALDLVGSGVDWCEFKINADVKDWMKLANECYKVCPDIVDQGTRTVAKLAEEMKRTKRLYFWWD